MFSTLDIDTVWAGHRVDFCLLTVEDRQYVAYYAEDRHMVVAFRTLDRESWHYFRPPSRQPGPPNYRASETSTILGWDSHNYISLAEDGDGHLHLSGNMHCNGLTYFRSQQPHDIDSLTQVSAMTGQDEEKCTYPQFLHDRKGDLIFHYRIGSSGSGDEIYNIYDLAIGSWRRLLDQPLTDGKGMMNAYMHEPVKGPDGHFHLSWVWRDTPDCATNHDLSYAHSPDLVNWFTAAGEAISLPISIETPGVVVDPVPVQGGIINGTGKVGFDSRGRPILTYHKFDAAGLTQAYNARLEAGEWVIYRSSDWDYRWYFDGGGSIINEIDLGAVEPGDDGRLRLWYRHVKAGNGLWHLDEEKLRPQRVEAGYSPVPPALMEVESDFPGMEVNWREDDGCSPDPATRFALRWEALPPHRDRPRSGPLPPAGRLKLYTLSA